MARLHTSLVFLATVMSLVATPTAEKVAGRFRIHKGLGYAVEAGSDGTVKRVSQPMPAQAPQSKLVRRSGAPKAEALSRSGAEDPSDVSTAKAVPGARSVQAPDEDPDESVPGAWQAAEEAEAQKDEDTDGNYTSAQHDEPGVAELLKPKGGNATDEVGDDKKAENRGRKAEVKGLDKLAAEEADKRENQDNADEKRTNDTAKPRSALNEDKADEKQKDTAKSRSALSEDANDSRFEEEDPDLVIPGAKQAADAAAKQDLLEGSMDEGSLTVMSYNTRYNNYNDQSKINAFGSVIAKSGAATVGTQECQKKDDLARAAGYSLVPDTDFQNPIFYDPNKVSYVGSAGWMPIPKDNYSPRTITWAKFAFGATEFWHFNTHLPHNANEAWSKDTHASIAQTLLEKRRSLGAENAPTVITGDMNPHASQGSSKGSFESNIVSGGFVKSNEGKKLEGVLAAGYDQIFHTPEYFALVSGKDFGYEGGSDHPAVIAVLAPVGTGGSIPVPTPLPTPGSDAYTKYTDKNAYEGFGAQQDLGYVQDGLSADACQALCTADPQCDCVTHHRADQKCWKRRGCNPDGCTSRYNSGYDLYVRQVSATPTPSSPPPSPTPSPSSGGSSGSSCDAARVDRRRRGGNMCSCRRRDGASSSGKYTCVGSEIKMT